MATGQALTSLALQAVAEDVSYELCTDSTSVLAALDLTDPPLTLSYQDLTCWCTATLRDVRRLGHLLELFRKVKAHIMDKLMETCSNNKADSLAELGILTHLDFHRNYPNLDLRPPYPQQHKTANSGKIPLKGQELDV